MNTIVARGDTDTLLDMVGGDILPVEYGGKNGTIKETVEFWKEELNKNKDWLHQQSTFKTIESKRKGKPRLEADIFGSNCVIQ